jgi:hypothetical protein
LQRGTRGRRVHDEEGWWGVGVQGTREARSSSSAAGDVSSAPGCGARCARLTCARTRLSADNARRLARESA